MKAHVNRIKVMERIRKELTKIDELAEDIKQNGLLNPVTVMKISDSVEELRLLAGLRRLKAVQLLKWPEIEITIVSPADAEARLRIEYSENEQREAFTFSEKMDYARMFQEIETIKAKERMLAGKAPNDPVAHGPQGNTKSREAIGEKVNMSGRQYDRAKYIEENASDEIIEQLDRGERSIRGTYDELRAKEREEKPSKPASAANKPPKPKTTSEVPDSYMTAQDKEAMRKIQEFAAMSPEQKITELQQRLKDERARAARAESELSKLKDVLHNTNMHTTANIDNLKMQVKSLDTALGEALARVKELEAKLAVATIEPIP